MNKEQTLKKLRACKWAIEYLTDDQKLADAMGLRVGAPILAEVLMAFERGDECPIETPKSDEVL